MRAGFYLGLVQLLFATTWTVYVVFLPALAESAGIARSWVVGILIADQIIFMAMDFTLGVAADRVARGMRQLGGWIAAISTASCIAFLLMPYAPLAGDVSAAALVGLMLVWSITSSALRAPPMVLLGKYAPPSLTPWLANLALFGLGLAGAVAPVLSAKLRGLDPRLPFALAGIGLLAAVAAMGWCERRLAQAAASAPAGAGKPAAQPTVAPPAKAGLGFYLAVAMLGLGFQVHTAINSAPAYLRFASAPMLEALMPVFWVGFSLLIMPAAWLTTRSGSPAVLAVGAVAGAACLAGLGSASSLTLLVALQLAAGAAWALVIGSMVNAAIEAGRSGREGRATGTVFALLALAAALRLSFVAAEMHKAPQWKALLDWMPAVCWAVAVLLCLAQFVKPGAPAATQRAG